MADRICVESSDYIIPPVLLVLSSQFQILFVWRECLGLQVLIVLTVLSFRFSRTVLQGRKRQHPFHGQASPVGVWSFLSLSSTRKKRKKSHAPEKKEKNMSEKIYARNPSGGNTSGTEVPVPRKQLPCRSRRGNPAMLNFGSS